MAILYFVVSLLKDAGHHKKAMGEVSFDKSRVYPWLKHPLCVRVEWL